MPELPEVQTIVDDLNKKVVGQEIISTWYDWKKFKAVEKTVSFKIERVKRIGKNILFYLASSLRGRASNSERDRGNLSKKILLVHQKMTGHLLVGKWKIDGKKLIPLEPETLKEKVNNYIHFILILDDKRMIGFSDLRKFGKVVFGEVEEVENLVELKKLGPGALDPNLKFEVFQKQISKKTKTIYQVLMDQEVVSGIGNIYASDILWEAKIHPFKKANKLNKEELKKIFEAMKKILSFALNLRGTSTADYRDTAGNPGGYGEKRLVYDRESLPCYECGTKIKRVKQAGRSSYFCPHCQE